MNRFTTYLIFLLTMFPLVWANAADVPYITNYQGSVKTTGGMPYDGNGYFKFAIVDSAGTTSYWSNDSTSAAGSEPTASVEIAVSNGLFSVKLGDVSITNMTTDLSGTVFDNTGTYIRTWFSDDDATFSQLSPDQQIVSTGHAIHAQSAETAVSLQPQTRYLSLPGTTCTRNPALTPYFSGASGLFCALSNQAATTLVPAIWPVDIPNGATILGLRGHVFTQSGLTTCVLRVGTNNAGTTLATFTDSTSGWHNTTETTLSHVVDTSDSAYYILCTQTVASGSNVIGHIRIRYTN